MLYAGLLNEQGEWCASEEECGEIVKRFYENLFKSTLIEVEKIDVLLTAVQPMITEEMNRLLERTFSIKEIKDAVLSTSADKSPGMDGWNECNVLSTALGYCRSTCFKSNPGLFKRESGNGSNKFHFGHTGPKSKRTKVT